MPEPSFEELIEAMRDAVAVLQRAEIPFVLGGGLSAWARGGPRSEHDVDFLVRPDDVDTALAAFDAEGWETQRPPEGWLVKSWHPNGALVDLIFNPASGPITDEQIERAPLAEVMAVRMHVSTLEDVMVAKLMALTEQEPDFGAGARVDARPARTDRLERGSGADRGLPVRASVLHARREPRGRRAN